MHWLESLEEYNVKYNTAPHRSLGKDRSPFELFYGRKPNCDINMLFTEE